jgi:hypothetical protein
MYPAHGFSRDNQRTGINLKCTNNLITFTTDINERQFSNYKTYAAMNDTFWIGVHPGLNEGMLGFVVEQIEAFLA